MFKKNASGGKGAVSVIGAALSIEGNLQTDENVRVDGKVKGTEHRVGYLSVGKTGVLVGNIKTGDGVIAGRVEGNVLATGKIEILQGAVVQGEIRAKSMLMHEGATFLGQVGVGEEKKQAKPAKVEAPAGELGAWPAR